jgi:non-specific protein-tyrosine kinase
LIFGFVALLCFGGLIFAYDYFNDLPRSPEELEEAAGAPVLGTVQEFDPGSPASPLVVKHRPQSPAAEAYRLIRTNLKFINVDRPPRTIVVSSPLPAEGKSTTVCNLAQAFADGGARVTLIDADLRRPGLDHVFQGAAESAEGLTSILASDGLNGYGRPTEITNLSLVASGPIPPNPADVLASGKMRDVLTHMAGPDGMVLMDTPPVLAVPDATILASIADGVVLVVDPHRTRRRDVKQAAEAIGAVGGKVLGVVMNRLRHRGPIYFQNYGQYAYKHGYRHQYGPAPSDGAGPVQRSRPEDDGQEALPRG